MESFMFKRFSLLLFVLVSQSACIEAASSVAIVDSGVVDTGALDLGDFDRDAGVDSSVPDLSISDLGVDAPDVSPSDMSNSWWNDAYSHRVWVKLLEDGNGLRMRVVLTAEQQTQLPEFDRESVAFVSVDGLRMAHEYELNDEDESQTFWVRGDFNVTDGMWMYWGGPSDESSPQLTWENYVAVMHFAKNGVDLNSTDPTDMTVMCNPCNTGVGFAGDTSFQAGEASRVDITPQPVTDIWVNNDKALTVSFWYARFENGARMTLIDAMTRCVGWRVFMEQNVIHVEFGTKDDHSDNDNTQCGEFATRVTGTDAGANLWHHLVFSINRSNANNDGLSVWIDGVLLGTSPIDTMADSNLAGRVTFGAEQDGSDRFQYLLEELRIRRGSIDTQTVGKERTGSTDIFAVIDAVSVEARVAF